MTNMKMTRIYFTGITEMGCCIQNAMVVIPEDYTMNQMAKAIKTAGYKMFMLSTMKKFVEI
mgnify:CR=1 FL=1